MRKVLLIALLCGCSAFFGTLGVLYGTATKEVAVVVEPVDYSTITDNWKPYLPKPKKVETPEQLLIVHTTDLIDYEPLDEFCLAKNIYHEARSEDLMGQMAVAQVTLNRLASERYPDTICKVVMQKFQFSWANDRTIRWTHPKGRAWHAAKSLASQFLAGGVRVSGLETALFYHADYVDPKWRDDEFHVATVGRHLFYEKAKPL